MNTIRKRLLSLFLCFVLIAGMLPVGAFANETGETATPETAEVTETLTQTASETEELSVSTEISEEESEQTDVSKQDEKEAVKAEKKEEKAAAKAAEVSTEPSSDATEPSSEATEPSSEPTEPEVIAVTGITLDQSALEVGVGELPMTLTATVLPENATDKTVTWESSEPGVVSVENGVLTFGYRGEAVITATAGGFSASCTVTVGEGEWTDYSNNSNTYVLAGSDFQADSGDAAGSANINNIISVIKAAGYTAMDGFLFAGDYSVNATKSSNVAALKNTIKTAYPELTDEQMVLIQGNHDNSASYGGAEAGLVGSVLNNSGENDAANYGVFVINEKDYNWKGKNETVVKQTAEELDEYLDAKRNAEYTKPIFVVSHLPLNYNMRTKNDGDGMYANYIFDVLNEAGEAGLNIIFLFGHDHSNGWDDYLGGSAVYLEKGDKINIAQASQTVFEEETLAFTYMNAGYVGYYRNVNAGSETDLTMTVFEITEDEVEINRFSQSELHDLKSAGVTNSAKGEGAYYSPNTEVYGSPQTVTLNKMITPLPEEERPVTVSDDATGITVSAVGLTGLNVDTIDAELPAGFTAYVSYDINPEGYTEGNTATVTIPVGSFDSTQKAVVLDHNGRQIAEKSIEDGKVTFTTTHFSVYSVGQRAAATVDGNTATGYLASLRQIMTEDELRTGVGYLIVADEGDDITLTGTANGSALLLQGGLTADNTNLWYWDGDDHLLFGSSTANDNYLQIGASTAALGSADGDCVEKITAHGNGLFSLYGNGQYLNRHGGSSSTKAAGYRLNNTGSKWRIYEVCGETYASLTVEPESVALLPYATEELKATVLVGGAETDDYVLTYGSSNNTAVTVSDDGLLTAVADGFAEITVTLTAANGQTAKDTIQVKIPVTVAERAYTVTMDKESGFVDVRDVVATPTGSKLVITYTDNNEQETIDVTVEMLTDANGNPVSTDNAGVFENLTLTYNGKVITRNYKLEVRAKVLSNYPEYPHEGAVKVNKTGTGIDFQSSGIAQVEISASGVPMKNGSDVIVMLDLSSSMNSNKVTVNGVEKTRLQVLRESMTVLLNQLQASDAEGNPMDIRIAVADFNRYYTDSSSPYYISSADHMKGGSIRTNISGTNKIYTGSRGINADAFVDVHEIAANAFETPSSNNQYYLGYQSGTNYDYAFDAIYQLGEAVKAKNEENGTARELFVIFMSDGAPFQYNYFSEQSSGTGGTYWNNWLQGTMTDDMFASGSNKSYYNEDGNHWMAEAIKGSPSAEYDVIRKNNAADTDGDNWVKVKGLGAKMYSIGFCLAVDSNINTESMDTVIRNIASEEKYYFRANSAADLNTAFAAIGSDIAYAAYNARFVDQMGDDYNLQMKTATYTVVENGEEVAKTLAPKIEIISYDIWTRQDYLDGNVTEDKIGDRKMDANGKPIATVLETVTFNADGTEVYSDKKTGNILNNGVISAQYFWYNTNTTAVAVEGVSIPTGTDSAGLTTGSSNVLPAETFYWKMGTVQTSELAMRYYVYLTGSMEGTRPGGSYPTNEYATLYYDNYLKKPCYKDTVSPVMAWKEANVSYAFYLVNEDGEIVVNQTTGQTGSFANKIAVTNPVVYETVLLNSDEEVSSIDIASLNVLPEGYTLYDYDGTNGATYTVTINSNTTGKWDITSVKNVATTYVTQYDPENASAYSNVKKEETVGHDYTHTVVWFAVLWKIQALPDSVVIDYGLPVDISVLTNDMFGTYGQLAGVGPVASATLDGYTATMNAGFAAEYKADADLNDTMEYGDAKMNTDGTVRYTLKTMEMDGYEKFAYAVNYTGKENAGYYYDTVTVIPATTIYYEDSFVDFDNLIWQQKEGGQAWEGEWIVDEAANGSIWKQEGTTVTDATQDEDRPGEYALTDANNIYGYDSVNKGMSTYSLGSAMKATVDYDNAAQASFTFTGTGFDVISMTDNTTGTILVNVYSGTDIVRNLTVDTYYGYTQAMCHVVYSYRNNEWVRTGVLHETSKCNGSCEVITEKPASADKDATVILAENAWIEDPNANSAVWQVPVMKVEGLPYGQYTAQILAVYDPALDHHDNEETYDFYLDAVRIYDPANDGAVDSDTVIEDAYVADGEGWPTYFELRNQLINATTLGNTATDTKITGEVFIDGDATVGDAQIADYISYGPNNEVYLNAGQSIAFLLDCPNNMVNVHIGVKSADGNPGTYMIKNIAQHADADNKVSAGQIYNEKTYTVDTTTDMYYDLTSWKNNIIVITNTGSSGIISLTNIKFTYASDPYAIAPSNDMSADMEASAAGYAYVTPESAALTLRSMNNLPEEEPDDVIPEESTPKESVPEITEPEVTEPEETEPDETQPDQESEKIQKEIEKALKKAAKELQKAAEKAAKALSKLFGSWF